MIKKMPDIEVECIDELDLEVDKIMEQCMVEEGEECVCPIFKFKVEGYQFQCQLDGCHERFVSDSREEVMEKAKEHMLKHLK